MAAGTIVVYEVAFEDVMKGGFDLNSATLVAHLCSAAYTPSAKSHSDWVADISVTEGLWTGYGSIQIASQSVSRTDPSMIMFDAIDITFSASALMDAKYCVIERQSNRRPLMYMDLETTATSGVAATQIIVQWPSTGLFRVNQSGIS